MATTVARLQAVLGADTGQFDKAMGKSESRMKSVAKTAGKAGLAGAVIGLGAAVKVGFDEFMEAQRVTAQTNAVIKSTAGVANVTTASVQKLSEALMKKSGVDDEQIQTGANMLLTFKGIRNEVGKGNDIFDQATKATLDMSVAMGKDMQSSALMLGKALNSPIDGMGKLQRVGVTFTKEQKIAVKEMTEMGNVAGAQKIILGELTSEFGGSAEAAGKTFSGQINIAKQTMSNFAGEMVGKSIPVLQDLVRVFKNDVVPAIKSVYGWVKDNIVPVLKDLWTVATDAWKGIAKVLKDNRKDIDTILGAAETLITALGTALLWLYKEVWIPLLSVLFTKLLPVALRITIEVVKDVIKAFEGIKDAFVWLRDKGGPAFEVMWKVAKVPMEALLGAVTDIRDVFKSLVGWIKDAVEWLGKIKAPSLPGWLDPRNIGGDPRDPNMTLPGLPVGNLMGANPEMGPFAALAATFGLGVTSGLRPGAITANGTPSDHGIGKAIDVAGSSAGMARFFQSLIGNRMVKQAFYDPLGSIFGGLLSSYREGGHSDHVHVATYDKGGWLKPGLTLAYNGTGAPERVGSAGNVFNFPNYVGSKQDLIAVMREAAAQFERRNGRSAF